ncbi:MAG: hypothetical protein QM301_12030 [Bacteroidota bacterium]|jgi:hypothetical protein|nr:hypothetical protein [Dehalococcoidia bacterium]MDI9564890.1 hypothetical protein [Bacteroidota bacterium]
MKNETDKQITRHSLPTQKCFNFLTHRTKILKLPTHIAHIAKAPQANAETKALSKSAILLSHKENAVMKIKLHSED